MRARVLRQELLFNTHARFSSSVIGVTYDLIFPTCLQRAEVLTGYRGGVVGAGLGRGLSAGGHRTGPCRSLPPRPARVLARWLHVPHARVLRPPWRHCAGACLHRHA